MSQKQLNLFAIPLQNLFTAINELFPTSVYDYKKHSVIIQNEQYDVLASIRLPLHVQIDDQLRLLQDETVIIYLTIEAGKGAIHVREGMDAVYYTTFSAYMTRKKQGFSQIKYLNKKGKSRAGSRVRLKSTEQFFENIGTTLTDLLEEFEVDRIAISCSATLWPFLIQSCPFDKKDPRLYKIPLHLPQSNQENLTSAINKLKAPVLFYEDEREGDVHPLLNIVESLKS